MTDKLLYVIPKGQHTSKDIVDTLSGHPEVRFVSLVGVDLGGHDTDEKIPVELFKRDIGRFLEKGVQTDGSSVVLPKISELNDAKVDIIPDISVNWYVDYNLDHISPETELPVGTLRIPSKLVHNDKFDVGSREILKKALDHFSEEILRLLKVHPAICTGAGIASPEDIDQVVITAATELEFWVKTPEEKGDREQLSTSQELKEQYWQRTRGSVRTALERAIILLEEYDFEIEMGHKEVGGVKARLSGEGDYTHIMEQLEIDWKYDEALQAADNELFIKYIVKDIFRTCGLEVTFMAKPIEGIAGSGEHTHLGAAARLRDGRTVNLFSAADPKCDFLNAIGYGALMGLLKNYEVINPFVAATNDALNRLKPGFEAPVCIVTSLGHQADAPSRNRTVLVGLIREPDNPLATRFELRAPCPKCNTYLVIAAACQAMLDGIRAALDSEKTEKDLEKAISKAPGEAAFYLETDRAYRSEEDVFETFGPEARTARFGAAPATVWENIRAFRAYPEKLAVLKDGGVMSHQILESYESAIITMWGTELQNRIIPHALDLVRACHRRHSGEKATDLDEQAWRSIEDLRNYIAKDTIEKKCLLTRIKQALTDEDYATASDLQIEMQRDVLLLRDTWDAYGKNII